MKTLLYILLLISSTSAAQVTQSSYLPIDSNTKMVTYQEVVQSPDLTKVQLYLKAKEWFVRNFKSANAVIQMDDKEAGKIMGKGFASSAYSAFGYTMPYQIGYLVSITVKDNRFRFEITNFTIELNPVDLSFSSVKTPIEQYFKDDFSNVASIKLSKKLKQKSIDAQVKVRAEVLSSTNDMATSLCESIKSALSKSPENSKDEF